VSSDEEKREPDYRFTLANERTFLAWLRTALALLAAAVVLDQFGPPTEVPVVRTALAMGLVALGALAAVGGLLRWRAVDAAMRLGAPLPRIRTPWLLAIGLSVAGVVVAALIVLDASARR